MTVPDIVGFLKTIGTRCMFISMETVTVLKRGKAIKTSCPFGDVTKKCKRTGWLNINYNAAVCRRVAARFGLNVSQVEYENGEVWFKHVGNSPVVVNKAKDDGKFYAFYFHRKTSAARYFAADGTEIAFEQIKPYLYAKKQNELKPPVRCVTLNNINVLKARGLVLKAESMPHGVSAWDEIAMRESHNHTGGKPGEF